MDQTQDRPGICLQLAIQVLMQDVDWNIAKIAKFSEEMAELQATGDDTEFTAELIRRQRECLAASVHAIQILKAKTGDNFPSQEQYNTYP